MEVAVIDWKSLDTRFVRDDLYEDINAPQWVDFSAPDAAVDDESWFCKPDCNHPKRFEDYYNDKTPGSKKPSILSEMLPLNDRNNRDATLKKRGLLQPMKSPAKDLKHHKRITEESENHNPNYLTPPNNKAKILKSSAEKREFDETTCRKQQLRSLRNTLSAKNLFASGDILSRVTEFCNELKKLATRARERETLEENMIKDNFSDDYGNLNVKEKERKPLPQVSKEKNITPLKTTKSQEKQIRKKKFDDAENTPVTVNSENIRKELSVLQIRTCPPTPQCFSASLGTYKAASTATTPLQPSTPKTLQRRGILQELHQRNVIVDKMSQAENQSLVSTAVEKGTKTLDVFWFLKPCAL